MATMSASDYRSKADECRRRARGAANPQQKAGWARLAEDWDLLADSTDASADQEARSRIH